MQKIVYQTFVGKNFINKIKNLEQIYVLGNIFVTYDKNVNNPNI